MPYTATQLTTYYAALTGAQPDAATSVLLQAYAQQNSANQLSDAQTLANVFNSAGVQATFEVAESTYQFFTGSLTSAPGQTFLEGGNGAGSPNTNGLNSTYYSQFNTENRYYNFAVNLASTGGAGSAGFASTYGTIAVTPTTTGGLSPFIQAAYEQIIGSANVGNGQAAANNPAATAAINDIYSRIGFFTQVAQQRAGGVDAGGAAGQNVALKAIIAGYILEEANKADVGTYAKALDQFEASIAAGNGLYGTSLTTSYVPGGPGFNTGVGNTAGSGTGGVNGGSATGTNLTPNIETVSGGTFNAGLFFNAPSGTYLQTLNTGDILNGTGAATLNVTFSNPNGGVFGAAQTIVPTLNSVSTINITDLDNIAGTNLDLSNSTGVSNIAVVSSTGPINIANNKSVLTSLSVANTAGNAVTVQSTGVALNGTADTLAFNLGSNVTGAVTAAGYEIVNLNSTGTNNNAQTVQAVNFVDGSLTTLNITGTSAAISLAGFTGTAAASPTTTLTTINAGGYAGALTIGSLGAGATFTAGTNTVGQTGAVVTTVGTASGLGASNLTFTGSTGVDTLVLNAGLNAQDTINGNGGADVLDIVTGDNPTAALNVVNIPTVQFYLPTPTQLVDGVATGPNSVFAGSATINRAFFGAATTTINLGTAAAETQSAAGGNTLSVTNLQTGNTIGFDYDATQQLLNGAGQVTAVAGQVVASLTASLATDSAADTLNVNFRDTDIVSTAGTTDTMTLLTATGFESLNLNLTGGVGVAGTLFPNNVAQQNTDTLNITTIQDTSLSQITVKGGTSLTLNSTLAGSLTNLSQIDASVATGNITLGTIAATPGTALGTAFTTINTGANISTGSGNDSIVLDVGSTGVLKNIVMGGEYFGFTANSPGTTAAGAAATTAVAPIITDFGNLLTLQTTSATSSAGVTQVDLSSTTDQIIQLLGATNTAGGQVQTGIDSIDLSGLSAGGTVAAGTAGNSVTVIGNANANFIIGTTGVDTISSGAGNDVVQGGAGGDSINVGSGIDTIRFVNAGDSLVGAGNGALTGASPFTINATPTTTTTDIVAGIVKGDRADFSFFGAGAGAVGTTTTAVSAGTGLAVGTAGQDALLRGTYDSTAHTFTTSATGSDYIYQHSVSTTAIVDVVLVGAAAAGVTQVIESGTGIATFG